MENDKLVKAIQQADSAEIAAEAERRQADPGRPQAVGFFSGWVEGGEDGQPVEFMVTAYGDVPREGTKLYALPPRDVLMALAVEVNDAALNFLGKPADLDAIVDRHAGQLLAATEGCGACGDGCKGQGCRLERESPPTCLFCNGRGIVSRYAQDGSHDDAPCPDCAAQKGGA